MFWSPLRLILIVVLVFSLTIAIGQLNRRLAEESRANEPEPSAGLPPEGLPSGWESWPKVPAERRGGPDRHDPTSTPAPTTSPSQSPTHPTTPTAPPSSVGSPAHGNGNSAEAAKAAAKVAAAFSAEFLNTGSGKDVKKRRSAWIKRLRPHVVPDLAEDLRTVDLARVPTGKVTGTTPATASDFNATVLVETSAGRMTVRLEWSGSAWQVADYLPPR